MLLLTWHDKCCRRRCWKTEKLLENVLLESYTMVAELIFLSLFFKTGLQALQWTFSPNGFIYPHLVEVLWVIVSVFSPRQVYQPPDNKRTLRYKLYSIKITASLWAIIYVSAAACIREPALRSNSLSPGRASVLLSQLQPLIFSHLFFGGENCFFLVFHALCSVHAASQLLEEQNRV